MTDNITNDISNKIAKADILLINGPNLNMLGQREPNIYGKYTLETLEGKWTEQAGSAGYNLQCLQSNHEGEIIDWIQKNGTNSTPAFMIINAGAYTHTSIAIRDALLSTKQIFIEVHISNVYQRENFRHQSLLSDISNGIIVGLGIQGYELAILAAHKYLSSNNTTSS